MEDRGGEGEKKLFISAACSRKRGMVYEEDGKGILISKEGEGLKGTRFFQGKESWPVP